VLTEAVIPLPQLSVVGPFLTLKQSPLHKVKQHVKGWTY
jgi:hypothetical protein